MKKCYPSALKPFYFRFTDFSKQYIKQSKLSQTLSPSSFVLQNQYSDIHVHRDDERNKTSN